MKKSGIIILILLCAILSCKNSKSKNNRTKAEKRAEIVKMRLSNNSEKIMLLSVAKKIPYDTLFLMLATYNLLIYDYTAATDSLHFYSEKAISSISEKYKISKSETARLIYSFKYEMLTWEEIVDKVQETELEQRQEEEQLTEMRRR